MFKRLFNVTARKLAVVHRRLEKVVYAPWFSNPFCDRPKATREAYLELAARAKQEEYPEIEEFESETGYAIDRDWLDDLALHTQVIIKNSPICYVHGRVLYSALSRYLRDHPPKSNAERLTILETGTSHGFSALCMAKALSDQDRAAVILTNDLVPHMVPMYWNCIDDHDRGPLTRAELLQPWQDLLANFVLFRQGSTRLELPKIQASRVHFAFLDGAHTFEDVLFEFDQIRERQKPGDTIVFDDYTESAFPGLVRAVDHICASHGYRRVNLQAHAGRGYVVASKT